MKFSSTLLLLPAAVPVALGSVIGKRNDFTSNWCGAVRVAPTGTAFKTVVGTWTIPKLSLRSGQTVSQAPSISQWVGISDDNGGLIQGGTYSVIQEDGSTASAAFVEMLPAALYSVDNTKWTIDPGDVITTTVTLSTPTTGVVTIVNSKGWTVSYNVGNVGSTTGTTPVSAIKAEWILEDTTAGGLVPFAAFPSSTFTGNAATLSDGTTVNADGSVLYDISQNGATLCHAVESGNVVTVTNPQ